MQITNAIRRLILGRALKQNKIVQFGVPRSGSTLVYNVLREAFPDRYNKKTHGLSCTRLMKRLKRPIVATYRHPLDVVASALQCHALEVTDKEIKKQLIVLNRSFWDILEIRDRPNVLLLRYEEFSGNFDFLFDEIENFLDQKIPDQTRTRLHETYNIKRVKSSIDRKLDFSHYDKETQFHGRHISKYEGKSNYYKEFFSPAQIEFIGKYMSFFMDEMGYTIQNDQSNTCTCSTEARATGQSKLKVIDEPLFPGLIKSDIQGELSSDSLGLPSNN